MRDSALIQINTIVNDPRIYSIEAVSIFSQDRGSDKRVKPLKLGVQTSSEYMPTQLLHQMMVFSCWKGQHCTEIIL